MTALEDYTPGLAGYDTDAYTPPELHLAGRAPTAVYHGKTSGDRAKYELVGLVTGTGLLIRSVSSASDGSEVPVGVTAHAVTIDDSNSGGNDSNSQFGADVQGCTVWTDGVFNFDALTKDSGWTVDTLNAVLAANGRNFQVDTPKTASPTEPA